MVFRDSFQFLVSSLENLTISLAKTNRANFLNFHEVASQNYIGLDLELLERKVVFCYDYVDFFARLYKLILPLREAFFN